MVTMLYVVLSGCNSLREISGIILACSNRINHLGINSFPRRSTLSDANKRRSSDVFREYYYILLKRYRKYLSDSKGLSKTYKNLMIVDSSTISLFSNILKGVGRNPVNGKKKGGIKIHTMISSSEDVPCLVRCTSAASHDHEFLKYLNLVAGSIVVFDRGYVDYMVYAAWISAQVTFVTRLKLNTSYKSIEEFDLPDNEDPGVLKDERIIISKNKQDIELRRVAYWDDENKRTLEFLTNNFELRAGEIAQIYKQRWQIELLFKRLKQNFPLKYFLGDNQNAIEIQIWSSLIADLILKVIKALTKKTWAYSNMVSVIRFHLMTYIKLMDFLNHPEAGWEKLRSDTDAQMSLFSSA